MMKRFRRFSWLMAIGFLFLTACNTQQKVEILVENPAEFSRMDEPVTISRQQLESQLGKTLPEGKVPLLLSVSGEVVPFQVDDLDGDGMWDELFFMVTMEAESSIDLQLTWAEAADLPVFETRTNIRMATISPEGDYLEVDAAPRLAQEQGTAAGVYQMEGPGWENDKVGFRNYLDARNGMDIFGKFTSSMILDKAGIGEDYHFKQSWGQDILRVATSLGSGSLALEKNGKLFRVAPEATASFQKVTEGPLRSILRLTYDNWVVEDQPYSLVHEISIHAGSWYYQSKVFFTEPSGEEILVAGITNIDLSEKQATISNVDDQYTYVMTHGPQAYDFEQLGMAIMLKSDGFHGYETVDATGDDITNSFLVRMAVSNEKPALFRYYSAWELSDPRFAEADAFEQLLKEDAMRLVNPLVVRLK